MKKKNLCQLDFQGAAYSELTIGQEKYVRATGSHLDLIAVYEFEVQYTGSYVIWKQAFATKNDTNDVSLRVDEGDWLVWPLPHKSSHALWTQYYLQVLQSYKLTNSVLLTN